MSGCNRLSGAASCLEQVLDPLQFSDPGQPVKWLCVMPALRENLP